jgi:hypothetical protein
VSLNILNYLANKSIIFKCIYVLILLIKDVYIFKKLLILYLL